MIYKMNWKQFISPCFNKKIIQVKVLNIPNKHDELFINQ